MPGTHIPIFHPDRIQETKPDYLLILPWNRMSEIMAQMTPEAAERLTVELAARSGMDRSLNPSNLPKIEGRPAGG